jgi:hypothetical protein
MLLTLLVAQLAIVNSAPKIPPAEALAILARMDSPSNWTNRFICNDCDGPRVTMMPYRRDDGPFGPFPVYELQSYFSAPYLSSYTPYYASPYASIYPYRTNISSYGRSETYLVRSLSAPRHMVARSRRR